MRIGILTPAVIYGDAVSNDVAGMYHALKQAGHDVRVHASDWFVEGLPIEHVDLLPATLTGANDLFIYHFSIGWQKGLDLLRTLPCRKVVKYHNVTPPAFFDPVNADYAQVCRTGREMLKHIATARANLFVSDSDYNKSELEAGGADPHRNFVIPPFHQINKLLETDADLETLDRLRDGKMNCLMVGRIAPNKGHVSLVEAFSVYHHHYNRESRLFLVGKQDPRLEVYTELIKNKIAAHDLNSHVHFVDGASDEVLKAYFLASHAFTIASEHEGFCVPLVEAMAYHLPVVGYASTAVSETAGNAALVWPERSPNLFAAALNEVYTNPTVAESLGRLGWERYRTAFHNGVIKDQFLSLIAQVENGAFAHD